MFLVQTAQQRRRGVSNPLHPYLGAVEDELRCVVTSPSDSVAPFFDMMAYHLGWVDQSFRPAEAYRGKRLRPLLCLLSCEAAGGDWHAALPAAAALELVHNFSLIHDDIEDDSPTRRGRPTVWKLWGLPHGVNVGDGMLMLARLALARLGDSTMEHATILAAAHLLDRTCLALSQGQYLDMAFEGRVDITEKSYLQMIAAKTAALIAASTELGALLAGAADRTEQYREFGWQLGLTFQMVDDLLGIWGDPQITGKPAASDIRGRKMTLPVIFALRTSDVSDELVRLYSQAQLSDRQVKRAMDILERAGAREYVRQLAAGYEARGQTALDASGAQGGAAQHLRKLAKSLTSRQE